MSFDLGPDFYNTSLNNERGPMEMIGETDPILFIRRGVDRIIGSKAIFSSKGDDLKWYYAIIDMATNQVNFVRDTASLPELQFNYLDTYAELNGSLGSASGTVTIYAYLDRILVATKVLNASNITSRRTYLARADEDNYHRYPPLNAKEETHSGAAALVYVLSPNLLCALIYTVDSTHIITYTVEDGLIDLRSNTLANSTLAAVDRENNLYIVTPGSYRGVEGVMKVSPTGGVLWYMEVLNDAAYRATYYFFKDQTLLFLALRTIDGSVVSYYIIDTANGRVVRQARIGIAGSEQPFGMSVFGDHSTIVTGYVLDLSMEHPDIYLVAQGYKQNENYRLPDSHTAPRLFRLELEAVPPLPPPPEDDVFTNVRVEYAFVDNTIFVKMTEFEEIIVLADNEEGETVDVTEHKMLTFITDDIIVGVEEVEPGTSANVTDVWGDRVIGFYYGFASFRASINGAESQTHYVEVEKPIRIGIRLDGVEGDHTLATESSYDISFFAVFADGTEFDPTRGGYYSREYVDSVITNEDLIWEYWDSLNTDVDEGVVTYTIMYLDLTYTATYTIGAGEYESFEMYFDYNEEYPDPGDGSYGQGITDMRVSTSRMLKVYGVTAAGDKADLSNNPDLTYNFNDASILNMTGRKLTAVGVGNTSITVTYKGQVEIVFFEVYGPDELVVNTIEELRVTKSYPLTIKAKYRDGFIENVFDHKDKLTITTSEVGLLEIDTDGMMLSKQPGFDTVEIRYYDAVEMMAIEIFGPDSFGVKDLLSFDEIRLNDTRELVVKAIYRDGFEEWLHELGPVKATNLSIAIEEADVQATTLIDWTVKGVAIGFSSMNFSYYGLEDNIYSEVFGPDEIVVTDIDDKSVEEIRVADTRQLVVKATYRDGFDIDLLAIHHSDEHQLEILLEDPAPEPTNIDTEEWERINVEAFPKHVLSMTDTGAISTYYPGITSLLFKYMGMELTLSVDVFGPDELVTDDLEEIRVLLTGVMVTKAIYRDGFEEQVLDLPPEKKKYRTYFTETPELLGVSLEGGFATRWPGMGIVKLNYYGIEDYLYTEIYGPDEIIVDEDAKERMRLGREYTLKALAVYRDDFEEELSELEDPLPNTYSIEEEDPVIATVTNAGVIQGVSKGSVNITLQRFETIGMHFMEIADLGDPMIQDIDMDSATAYVYFGVLETIVDERMYYKVNAYKDEEKTHPLATVDVRTETSNFRESFDEGATWNDASSTGTILPEENELLLCGKIYVGPQEKVWIDVEVALAEIKGGE